MNKNDWLATKVMGFTIYTDSFGNYYQFTGSNDNGNKSTINVCGVRDWNPSENIAQSFMLLDKLGNWCLKTHRGNTYSCRLGSHQPIVSSTKCNAITEAALKVSGYYE